MAFLIQKGKTDVTRYVMMVDSASGQPETGLTVTDFDLSYLRAGSDHVAKVDATALAAVDSAHGDNKAIEVDATLFPGLYRVDWPDAAFVTGVSCVELSVTCSGCHPAIEEIQLVSFDPDDAVRMGMTALPNAAADAAGGLPISDAGGLDLDTQIGTDIDAILADTNEMQGDLTDAGRLDALIDAIKAKTDNLPADPADDSDIDAQLATIAGYLDTEVAAILAAVDTEVAAIKAVTDNIPDSGALTTMAGNIVDILTDTAEIGAAGAGLTGLAAIVWDEGVAGHTGGSTFGGKLQNAVPSETLDDYKADVSALATAAALTTVDTVVDAIKAVTDNLPDSGALTALLADVAAILTDTAEIGAAGAGLTAVPWNAAWDAEVQSEVTDGLNAYDPPTKAELDSGLAGLNDPTAAAIADAVWDEAISGHTGEGSTGEALDGATAPTTAQIVTALAAATWTAGGVATLQDIIIALYAYVRGRVAKDSDDYSYYDDDGDVSGGTKLFENRIASSTRTPQ